MTHDRGGGASRSRFGWIAALVAAGAVIVAIAIGVGALRAKDADDHPPSAEQMAQQRCQSEVMKRLVAPDKAALAEIRTETGTLDPEGRDYSPLATSAALKGVDPYDITVLNVSGVVNAPSEIGSTIEDHFDCRAYFVNDTLADVLIVFDHDH